MEGIFAAINFKGIDKEFSDKDYFKSPYYRAVKKEKFILITGKDNGLTKSDYHFDERYELLSISRIDNKNSLLKEYNLSKDTTNSKLILFLYKKFKIQAFNKIFGGFSAIIIDKKFNKIKAFTDHLNQKPLFYSKDQSNLFFSSSIESLFQSGVKRNQICDEVLLDYLVCGAPRVNKTIYKNVNILPSNCFLKFNEKEKIKIKSFYVFKSDIKKSFKNSNYYQTTIKEIFFKIIKEQLIQADTNLSLALSGGLDSSSVVCVANKINKEKKLNKNLSTNSAIFPALKEKDKQKADETNFIELVLNKTDTAHNYYEFFGKGSLSILDKLTNFNEPMMGPNVYINVDILEKVKLKKHNVYFDGNGGDNVGTKQDYGILQHSHGNNSGGNSNYGTAIVGTVSGTSISFGSAAVFESAAVEYNSIVYDSNAQKVVIAYRDGGVNDEGMAVVGTVSGTSISFGTPVEFDAQSDHISAVYDATAQKVVIAYQDRADNYGKVVAGTVSGTSISFTSPATFESANTEYVATAYDSSAGKVAIGYRDLGNSNYGTSVVYQTPYTATNLTSENFIGFAENDCTDNGLATIQLGGSVNAKQTSLTAGQTYFVQTNGTIGTTAASPSVTAGTAVSATKILVKG